MKRSPNLTLFAKRRKPPLKASIISTPLSLGKELRSSKALFIPMNAIKATCFIVTIIAVLLSFVIYPTLPGTVPVHWNALGQVDGYGPNWMGAFLVPAIMAFVLLLFVIIPKIEVFQKNLKAFEKEYWLLCYVLQLFFLVLFALTLLPNYGYCFNFAQIFALPFGMLFISIGILLPSFKRTFFVGIRTPWSLANDEVWKKTHVFGGKAFILAGLATLVSAPFPNAVFIVLIIAILLAAISSIVYSYVEFTKHRKIKL